MNTIKEEPFTRHEILLAVLMCIFCIMLPFGLDSYVPSLPAMTIAFNSTPHLIELTVTLYMLGGVLSQLITGPLSDRFGRRKLVLGGMCIAILGAFLCVIAKSVEFVIFARCIQGAGTGTSNALFRAVMRDTFNGLRLAKMGSLMSIFFLSTAATAPVIGGYIQTWFGWRGNFIFFVILVAISAVIVFRLLPETNKKLDPTATQFFKIIRNYTSVLTNRIFLGFTMCSGFGLAGLVVYLSVSPFLLQNIVGLTPSAYGWVVMFQALGIVGGMSLNGALLSRFGIRNMIYAGLAIMIITGSMMLVFGLCGIINTWVIAVPAVIFNLACGFVFANAMSGAVEPFPHIAGITGALYGALQLSFAFITTLFSANLHLHNQIPLASIFIVLGVAGFLAMCMIPKMECVEK